MNETMILLLVLSTIVWYVVDRFKELWAASIYSKYITMACAAVLSAVVVFTYGLDILVAVSVVEEATVIGKILSTLIIMSGSSALSEVVNLIKSNTI